MLAPPSRPGLFGFLIFLIQGVSPTHAPSRARETPWASLPSSTHGGRETSLAGSPSPAHGEDVGEADIRAARRLGVGASSGAYAGESNLTHRSERLLASTASISRMP
jgi:hypothetical protein